MDIGRGLPEDGSTLRAAGSDSCAGRVWTAGDNERAGDGDCGGGDCGCDCGGCGKDLRLPLPDRAWVYGTAGACVAIGDCTNGVPVREACADTGECSGDAGLESADVYVRTTPEASYGGPSSDGPIGVKTGGGVSERLAMLSLLYT